MNTPTTTPRAIRNSELADTLGKLCANLTKLEDRKKQLTAEFLRRGFVTLDGKLFRLTRVETEDGTRLDTKKIQETMPEDWIEKFSLPTHREPYAKVSALTSSRNKPQQKVQPKAEPARALENA